MERIGTKHISLLIVGLKVVLIAVVVVKYLPYASKEDLTFNQTFFGSCWQAFWHRLLTVPWEWPMV